MLFRERCRPVLHHRVRCAVCLLSPEVEVLQAADEPRRLLRHHPLPARPRHWRTTGAISNILKEKQAWTLGKVLNWIRGDCNFSRAYYDNPVSKQITL